MGIKNGTFLMDAIVNYVPAAANITGGQSIPVSRGFSASGMLFESGSVQHDMNFLKNN
jgi:hypothetical protein